MDTKFIMDDYGNFEIEVNGVRSQKAMYESIASIRVDDTWYIAVSDYFAGIIPSETVLKVEVVK